MKDLALAINQVSDSIERGFNLAACIPVVGTYSSPGRIVFGASQVMLGSIVQISGLTGLIVSYLNNEKGKVEKEWGKIAELGTEHAIHGALNILRGIGEFFVSLITFSIGNVVLLIPNIMRDTPFAPAVAYGKMGILPKNISQPSWT